MITKPKIVYVTCPRPECAVARGGYEDAFPIKYTVRKEGDKYAAERKNQERDLQFVIPTPTNINLKNVPINFTCPWCEVESTFYVPISS